MHGAHLFGLLNVSQGGLELEVVIQWWWQPSSFLSVTCCGEAFHKLGIQGGWCFISTMCGSSAQGGFGVIEHRLSASVPYSQSWISPIFHYFK
jgi:hypothetical protein